MKVAITMDIDWASEDCILMALDIILPLEIPMTVFLTHQSKIIRTISQQQNWEIEPHPNYLPLSDHGNSVEEVNGFIHNLVHPIRGLRMHRYLVPTNFSLATFSSSIKYMSNDYTQLVPKPPYINSWGCLEIPVFFEDGIYSKNDGSFLVNEILERMNEEKYFVFSFHPIHLALNTKKYSLSRNLKDNLTRGEYKKLSKEKLIELKNHSYGMSNLLIDLISKLKQRKCRFLRLEEIANDVQL